MRPLLSPHLTDWSKGVKGISGSVFVSSPDSPLHNALTFSSNWNFYWSKCFSTKRFNRRKAAIFLNLLHLKPQKDFFLKSNQLKTLRKLERYRCFPIYSQLDVCTINNFFINFYLLIKLETWIRILQVKSTFKLNCSTFLNYSVTNSPCWFPQLTH